MPQSATSIAGAPIQIAGLRVAALAANGAPLTGTHGYCTPDLVSADIKPDVEKGADFVVKNAQNNICQEYRDCDRLKSFDITLEFCTFHPDLVQLLIGGVTLQTGPPYGNDSSSGGKTQAYQFPHPLDACGNGVCLELWQLLWDGDQQMIPTGYGLAANSVGYVHWVFPRVFGQIGDFKLEANFTNIKVDLVARENQKITGNGPFDDWAAPLTAFGGIEGLGGFMIDAGPPACADIGLINVPSAAS